MRGCLRPSINMKLWLHSDPDSRKSCVKSNTSLKCLVRPCFQSSHPPLFSWNSMASVTLRWKTQPRAILSCCRKLRHSSRLKKTQLTSSVTTTRLWGCDCGTLSSGSYRSSEWGTLHCGQSGGVLSLPEGRGVSGQDLHFLLLKPRTFGVLFFLVLELSSSLGVAALPKALS